MKITRNILKKMIFAFFVIVSLLSLFINKGLYFFELNNNIEVRVSSETADVQSFINDLNDQRIVRIDRINNILYYENSSIDEVQNSLNNANSDNKFSFDISNNFYQKDEVLKNYVLMNLLIVISSAFIFIYFILKNKPKLSGKQGVYLTGIYLVLALFSNLFLAGSISLLSRYYQVRELELTIFVFMNIWLSVIYFTAIWRLKEETFDDISSIYASEDFNHKSYLFILFLILAAITIGLGVNFVVTAILIILSILFVSFNFYNIGNIVNFKLTKPNITIKQPSFIAKKQSKPLEDNAKSYSTPVKKKKSKSKKRRRK